MEHVQTQAKRIAIRNLEAVSYCILLMVAGKFRSKFIINLETSMIFPWDDILREPVRPSKAPFPLDVIGKIRKERLKWKIGNFSLH